MRILLPYYKALIALLLGILGFYLVVGPFALDPRNIAWLGDGYDPSGHYLGWEFFRVSPWSFPIGLNPNYGLGISSSIVLADAIPLMAFLMKPFSVFLPTPFQYLGFSVLICLVLQAYFALKILTLLTSDTYLQVLGAALMVFSPPMLARIGVHTSLVSHFLVLASLYLVIAPVKFHSLWWTVLLCAASLIHFYLFAMVASLWCVGLLQHSLTDAKKNLIGHAFLGVLAVSIVFWQAGYFSLGLSSSSTGHYGIGHWNLLSLLDASSWSYLLPTIPDVPGYEDRFAYGGRTYESFSYLGLGLIICLGFALWGLRYHKVSLKALVLRYRFLVLMLGLLTLFAISNNIGIGPWNITFPLPESVRSVASILRASARMFWPVYYALILLIFYIIIKSYSRKSAIAILSVGLLIQIADTSAGWLPLRHKLMQPKASEWGTSLTDPFWNQAAEKYQKVVIVPEMNFAKGWRDIASYSVKNGMATNAVYLGRVNQEKLRIDNEHYLRQIAQGTYDQDTLYLINKELVIGALKTLSPRDALIVVNQQFVVVPNYAQCEQCQIASAQLSAGKNILSPSLGEDIVFNANGFGVFLLSPNQWGEAEPWGTWASGNQASLVIPLPPKGAQSLTLTARAFVTPKHPTQDISIAVNGSPRQEVILTHDSNIQIVIPITKADQQAGYLNIHFHFKNPAKPKDLGLGDDDRLLSLGLISAIFH